MPSPTIAHLIEETARRFSLPGGVVAIVDGDTSEIVPFGVRRLGATDKVDAATTFSIASCSKALTACAVASLVDQGALTWDDRVRTHLPEFELYDLWISEHITLRDLLGMRTGLDRSGICEWGSNPSIPPSEIFRRLRFTKPATGFRERYGYTNVAYSALSEIVVRTTGTDFKTVLRDRIFAPLDMRHAFVAEGIVEADIHCAIPHTRIDNIVAPLPAPRCGGRFGESCGYLSGADAAAWMRYVVGVAPRQPLLGDAAFAEMFLPQSLGSAEPRLGRTFQHYCMGWEECDYFGDHIFCHEGGEFGASSRTMVNRDTRLGIAVYLNVSSPAVRALSLAIYDSCRGRAPRDWSGELPVWMAADADARAAAAQRAYACEPGAPAPFAPAAFEGCYTHPANGPLRLTGNAKGFTVVFDDSSILDGEFEHLGGDIYSLVPRYAGMRDNLKGRARIRLTMADGARVVDVMGFGHFVAAT